MSLDKPFTGKAELRLLLEPECSSAPDPILLRTKYFGFSVTFVDLDLDTRRYPASLVLQYFLMVLLIALSLSVYLA